MCVWVIRLYCIVLHIFQLILSNQTVDGNTTTAVTLPHRADGSKLATSTADGGRCRVADLDLPTNCSLLHVEQALFRLTVQTK